MPDDYGTNLNRKFATAALKIFYERSVGDEITNKDYEGDIKGVATKVDILTFQKMSWVSYTGADLSASDIQEVAGQLTTDQQKAYYFKVKKIDQLKSWIENPQGTVIEQLGNELREIVDTFILAKWGDVAAGNRVGTDYDTGDCAVDSAGVVTGNGTTFTSSMVGRGFQATGHTDWYRVKTFSSTTSITIENDSDDETSAYGGGVISGGTSYTIEAATVLEVNPDGTSSKAAIYDVIVDLKEKLDEAEIPEEGRWLVIPTKIHSLLLKSGDLSKDIESAYEAIIRKGFVGSVAGFKVFRSERIAGDNTAGFRVLAGHTAWQTMAEALVEAEEEPFISGNFGRGYKGLFVYGTKVLDERRKAAAEAYIKAVAA